MSIHLDELKSELKKRQISLPQDVILYDEKANAMFDPYKVLPFVPFKRGCVVVGAMFGDEGKGKQVDAMADQYKKLGMKVLSIRGQGSGNAGHTVIVDGERYDFHYLTSAGLLADIMLLGPGMLIDPIRVSKEMLKLPEAKRKIVQISERATLVTDLERVFDAWAETKLEESGQKKIGTTKSGVGPAAGIRGFRFHVTFADVLTKCKNAEDLRKLFLKNPILPDEVKKAKKEIEREGKKITKKVFSKSYCKELWDAIFKLNIVNSVEVIQQCRAEGDWAVLLEVSQAIGLDPLFGNGGHFCTSTPCTDVGGIYGSGLTKDDFSDGTFLMAKAYTSKVGGGPFPTKFEPKEMHLDKFIDDIVGEHGVTTGRKRDLGWFDGVMARYAIAITGGKFAINCMDVVASMGSVTGELKVCFAYRNKVTGKVIRDPNELEKVMQSDFMGQYKLEDSEPRYVTLPIKEKSENYMWQYKLEDYEPLYVKLPIKRKSEKQIIREYIELLEFVIYGFNGGKIVRYGVGPSREDYKERAEAFKND